MLPTTHLLCSSFYCYSPSLFNHSPSLDVMLLTFIQRSELTNQPTTHPLCSTTHPLCSTTHPLCSTTHPLCSLTLSVQPLTLSVQPLTLSVQPLTLSVQPLTLSVQARSKRVGLFRVISTIALVALVAR